MREAAKYPSQYREVRMRRFYAHMLEWNWFYNEGLSKNNPYLTNLAMSNLVLYGGRAILAYNELLFPYHKWFLKVLEQARNKPANMMELIGRIFDKRSHDDVAEFVSSIKNFTDWGIADYDWAITSCATTISGAMNLFCDIQRTCFRQPAAETGCSSERTRPEEAAASCSISI